MELPNESASLVVIFVLLYFVFIWDESVTSCFHQKYRKSFYSYDKNKLFSYDIIRGIQQATSISFFFFSFLGINEGIKRKHILHSLVADQSTGFLARSRVPSQCFNSREIGKTCQQRWRIQHQNHDDYDFLITYENETLSTTRLITLVFLNALEHQSTSLRNLTR